MHHGCVGLRKQPGAWAPGGAASGLATARPAPSTRKFITRAGTPERRSDTVDDISLELLGGLIERLAIGDCGGHDLAIGLELMGGVIKRPAGRRWRLRRPRSCGRP